MTYKGYEAKVHFDDLERIFHGDVINTRDVITFQGSSVDELERAFHDSVDDYLEFCASRGEEPEKPFSGKFMVRVTPDLHKTIVTEAGRQGKSVNKYVASALRKTVARRKTMHA